MDKTLVQLLRGEPATSLSPETVAARARELAFVANFSDSPGARSDAFAVLRGAASAAGIFPASMAACYAARGRGEILPTFTVPAINVRGMTFDVAAAAFRAMRSLAAGAVVFEINRAEVGFTGQRPAAFAASVLAAALAEQWEGPVFIQLDHLMANAAAFHDDPDNEVRELEELIAESIAAGFSNVDIDASTLVDLDQPTVELQQQPNIEVTALLARYVRQTEPPGTRVSLGGEIGEVGGHNSTPEELHAFMRGFLAATEGAVPGGLAKVSVQTGTRHGGVRGPDGSILPVALDFETLETLSRICREEYGMAGAVQHGASTLPEALFPRFVEAGCAEVHLATGFQDAVLDHPAFPVALREEMHAWTLRERAAEREPGESDARFVRRVRRRAWAPFQQACWEIDGEARSRIMESLESRFRLLFLALGVAGGRDTVARYAAPGTA